MATEICRVIGANIRLRRKAMGMTLQDLAKALGVSYQQVQKYEKGTNRIPCDMLVLAASKLGCTPDELCGLQKMVVSQEGQTLAYRFACIQSPQLRRNIIEVVETIISSAEPHRG